MKFLAGSYNLIENRFTNYGNVAPSTKTDSLIEITCGHDDAQYIKLRFDISAGEIEVTQDRSTSPLIFYYCKKDNEVFFSTSLKKLIVISNTTRTLNEEVVEEFILNGFIYGEDTLIEEVKKLAPLHKLVISKEGVHQIEAEYPIQEMSEDEAKKKFKDTLDKAVENCIADLDEINVPLSSGYDSNYINYIANQKEGARMNAFSIGGKFGKNELPIVEENVKHYPKENLFGALTDSNTLQYFPDIVWRLEGAVYENGLFLQYELNKLVNEKGKKTLVCGECADQVLNKYYFDSSRLKPQREEDGSPKYYEFSEYPYVFGTQLILKKNGILANSFDIETRYPFLDEELSVVAKPLGVYNQKNKRIHVENCNAHLPKEIIENISKIGGATECISLFENEEEIKRFFKSVEKSSFYKKHKVIIRKHTLEEKERQKGIDLLKTKALNAKSRLAKKKDADKEANARFHTEIKLREYLCVAYLVIFNKQFIEESDIEQFKNNETKVTFDKIF